MCENTNYEGQLEKSANITSKLLAVKAKFLKIVASLQSSQNCIFLFSK